jgi:hypothetical protein
MARLWLFAMADFAKQLQIRKSVMAFRSRSWNDVMNVERNPTSGLATAALFTSPIRSMHNKRTTLIPVRWLVPVLLVQTSQPRHGVAKIFFTLPNLCLQRIQKRPIVVARLGATGPESTQRHREDSEEGRHPEGVAQESRHEDGSDDSGSDNSK